MACGGIDPHNIFLWLVLAGILLGGGLSFLICPVRRRNLSAALIFFSAAILSVLCGVIIAGLDLSDLNNLLAWFGVCVTLGYAAFLFWKIIGIPLFFLLLITVSLVFSSLVGWHCVSPGLEICRFNVVSQADDFIRIQYVTENPGSGQQRISAGLVRAEFELIEFPDYFFLATSRRIYRFTGFYDDLSSETVFSPGGIILSWLIRLPGFDSRTSSADVENPAPSIDYIYSFSEEGDVNVTRSIGM